MASSLLFTSFSPPSSLPILSSIKTHLSPSPISLSIKPTNSNLSSSRSLSGFPLTLPKSLTLTPSASRTPPKIAVFAAKGYKMKTHKASAKRFRVTGKGKIVRRRAGKQHLLAKKNTKRKLRLSKMIGVDKSDYDNVIGALPYLKVNRKAT
ncbi:uncharacterized protein A4U43_C02F3120 [Asparagus officinalis]|uniref:50S ribosomal protein L35 n=1 Tax=Asparagus officinalis TaxID=4686 RepID=A0A5P1FG71_ASPOF|nr:50S ribosomal protein L35, chloroplastic [Asparagus officinalis]XP_020252752.1 50S ribosomal protein L35, chloroplastic [Asparagus officinalis]XP_020252753.1 50S ribosomal protein L35, chloroplastic [Asparagus officinalis]ONK77102.1 uncharacterized protein A4U43_C02F3120 [Asparagus officinalis]